MLPIPEEAFPFRAPATLWSRIGDVIRERRLRNTVMRVCVVPPPNRWARFGRSVVVPPARVSNPDCISIGDGVVIHENVWLSVVREFPDVVPEVVIEDNVRIGRGCQLSVAGEVTIGAGAIIGDFVQIGDTYHAFEAEDRFRVIVRPQPVHIGTGAIIGSHATILPGVTVGAGAYVEHRSVVARDVDPDAFVEGNPARPRASETR